MGKPFQTELRNLDATYAWARTIPLDNLAVFARATRDQPLISVGSGGSLTAAAFAALLHQETGMISQYLTPLEITSSNYSLQNVSVLLITAGGRNYDAIQSFKKIISSEPAQLMVLCGSKESPIVKLAKSYGCVRVSEFDPPSGRDGFLAVNSLLAFAIFLTRSYGAMMSKKSELPDTLQGLVGPPNERQRVYQDFINADQLRSQKTFIILYGKWGKPAALDLESKLSEAALANVILADYRNFAHGLHNWVAKRPEDSVILALTTPEDIELATKTLRLIPKSIPVFKVSSSYDGPLGTINLLVQAMHAVLAVGELRKIDPGRPGVPEFGQRIYNLRINTLPSNYKSSLGDLKSTAIERKIGHFEFSSAQKGSVEFWSSAYDSFLNRIELARFGGLVFDYDGTLCDPARRFGDLADSLSSELIRLLDHNISIGIATGRGRSVGDALRRKIPKEKWYQIIVGYYNGSDIGPLNNQDLPNKTDPVNSLLSAFISKMNQDYYTENFKIEPRPKQVTFEPIEPVSLHEIFVTLNELAHASGFQGLSVVRSSHSIDVLAPGVSKLNLVRFVQRSAKHKDKDSSVLCIGDSGAWPGNDYEMLNEGYSLSVDAVSSSPSSCWNLAPRGYRGEQATLTYLAALNPIGKLLGFDIERLSFQYER